MTLAQAHAFVCAVFDTIKRRVADPAERLAIMEDVGRLMGYGPAAKAPLRLEAGSRWARKKAPVERYLLIRK